MPDTAEQFDVEAQQLGAIYAQAFVDAAEGAGQLDALVAELDSLIDDVLAPFPKLEAALASEMIPLNDRLATLDRVFAAQASPMMMNFLKVVAQRGRLANLRDIRGVVHDLVNEIRGRVRVEVTSAIDLDPALRNRLAEQFREMLGREPHLVARTDPGLLGGLRLRVGDTVYDGSVVTRLDRVRRQLQDRTTAEIERGRAKFVGGE